MKRTTKTETETTAKVTAKAAHEAAHAVAAKTQVHRCCCSSACKSECKGNFAIGHDAKLKGLLLNLDRGTDGVSAANISPLLTERMSQITFLQEAPYAKILKAAMAGQTSKRTRTSSKGAN